MKIARGLVFRLAQGYRGRAKNCYTIAIRRVQKGLQYAKRDRRAARRDFRTTWIQGINAGANEYNLKYHHMINKLTTSGVALNRRMLCNLALYEPYTFRALANEVAGRMPYRKVMRYGPRPFGHLYTAVTSNPKIDYVKAMAMEKAEREADGRLAKPDTPVYYDHDTGRWQAVANS